MHRFLGRGIAGAVELSLTEQVTNPRQLRNLWIMRHVLPNEPVLRRYLRRQRMPDGIDAEDIVQEVYGRVIEMETLDHIREPRGFLVGMARNILLMHHRRSRLVTIFGADHRVPTDLPDEDPGPEQAAADRQQLHMLAIAVARTREPWRSAFLLRVMDELPHAEIGRRLGLSENAVQKGLAKTLARLIDFLGRGGNDRACATQSGDPRKDDDGAARAERAD